MSIECWLDALRSRTTKADRTALIVATLRDAGQIAAWSFVDPDELAAWLLDVAVLVTQRVANTLATAIKRARSSRVDSERSSARRERFRVVEPGETEESARTIGDELGRDDLPVLLVPPNWTCGMGGIYALQTKKVDGEDVVVPVKVSHRVVLTTGILVGVDTGDQEIVIEWQQARGGWGSAVIQASVTQDPRAFVLLRNQGAPISLHGARDLATWLDDLENTNRATIPRAWHTTHLGWQGEDGRLGFVWGRKLLTKGAEVDGNIPPGSWTPDHVRLAIPDSDGRRQLADGCSSDGTWEGWCDVIALVAPYPKVMLAVYASLGAALLRITRTRNPIIDWSGETSKGKTTALAVAASCWGRATLDDAGLMRKWDVSAAALESHAEMCKDVPIILDDTKTASTNGRAADIGSLIYHVASGQGRGRGRPDGGQRRTATWRTILLSTGEAPATSFTKDAGSRARVVTIMGAPIPKTATSKALVDRIEAGLRENYGHAGPRLVRWLLDHPKAADLIRQRYALACEEYAAVVDVGSVGDRLSTTLALLEAAAGCLHECLGVPKPDVDPIEAVAIPAVRAGAADADQPSQALRAVWEWSVTRTSEFWGRHPTDNQNVPTKIPTRGWAGVWVPDDLWTELAFVPGCLDRVLRYYDYSPDDVLPRWQERGWLAQDKSAAMTLKRYLNGQKVRCVAILRPAIEHVAGIV